MTIPPRQYYPITSKTNPSQRKIIIDQLINNPYYVHVLIRSADEDSVFVKPRYML